MGWFFAAVMVVIVGFVFFVAAGRGGEMAPQIDDRPVPRLPDPDRPLTSSDLDQLSFAVVTRGYSMEQVDELLDRLARQLDGTRGGQPGPVSSEHDSERTGSVTEVAESEPSIVEPSASEQQTQAATPTVKTAPAESQPNVSQTAPSASQPGSSDASDARPERLE